PVLLYFFCNNRAEDRRSAMSILRSLAYQIVMQRPDVAEPIESLRKASKSARAEALDDLWTAFETSVDKAAKGANVYLVIDALDECTENVDERTSLLRYLSQNESVRS